MCVIPRDPANLEGGPPMCHIRHMRTVTIRKLHEETGRIVDAAAAGEVITCTVGASPWLS